MTDVNDDVQSVTNEMRASQTSVCYYLEYSVHRDVWYRLGGMGMTLYAWALDTLKAARKPNSQANQHIRKLYGDAAEDEIKWRLTKQTTITEVMEEVVQ